MADDEREHLDKVTSSDGTPIALGEACVSNVPCEMLAGNRKGE